MAIKQTKFNDQWLDPSLHPTFTGWLRKNDKNNCSAFCSLCKKTIDLSNMGRQALISHAGGKGHKNMLSGLATQQSLKSFLQSSGNLSKASTSSVTNELPSSLSESGILSQKTVVSSLTSFAIRNAVTRAETIWALRVVEQNMSRNSCSNLSETFQLIFPDSNIASKFSLGETKCSCIINHGLDPFFQEELQDRIRNIENIVVCFDEALNKVIQKGQMDIFVKYFDINRNRVQTQYYNSNFLGKSSALDLLDGFNSAIQPISKKRILQISMDGPNVNLSFLKKFEEQSVADDPSDKLLINIGVCGLHVVDGAVKTGMNATKWNLNMFLRDLYYILNDSPARRAAFTETTGCTNFPLKYCGTRWLENGNCSDRALKIIDDVKKYFDSDKAVNTKPYKSIQEHVSDTFLKCKLSFFRVICGICEPFLKRFQSSFPLAPFLYSDLMELLNTLMLRCVKPDVLRSADIGSKLVGIDLHDSSNLMDVKKIDIGFQAKKMLKSLKHVTEHEVYSFRSDCRLFLINMIDKLKERSPLNYTVVRGLASLDPTLISLKPELGRGRAKILLEALFEKGRINENVAEKANAQYSLLCSEATNILNDKFDNFYDCLHDKEKKEMRLDDFYAEIMHNNSKYSELWEVVKISLTLSHGNASVESGFSVNKTLLTENQKETSIVAQRVVYDSIKFHEGVKNVTISQNMLTFVRSARSKYVAYLEKNKEQQKESESDDLNKTKLRLELNKLQEERKMSRTKQQIEEECMNEKIKRLENILK